ncbi:MAG: deaminase [Aquificae bacterium]|nr:deaminase [Aquificota bacterium]
MKEIKTKEAPLPVGPYSQAILAGNLLFISGQIGIEPLRGELVRGFENQVRTIFRNVDAILKEAGLSRKNVVRVVIYLTELKNFQKLNEIYEEYFREVEPKPARVTVGVKELPLGAQVEIELIALAE